MCSQMVGHVTDRFSKEFQAIGADMLEQQSLHDGRMLPGGCAKGRRALIGETRQAILKIQTLWFQCHGST